MRQIGDAANSASQSKKKRGTTVQINGGQMATVIENVVKYEMLDLQAAVYHKLTLEDGSILYVNDFGIRSVHVRPEGVPPAGY